MPRITMELTTGDTTAELKIRNNNFGFLHVFNQLLQKRKYLYLHNMPGMYKLLHNVHSARCDGQIAPSPVKLPLCKGVEQTKVEDVCRGWDAQMVVIAWGMYLGSILQ